MAESYNSPDETLELFIKSSSFVRFLLNQVLSKQIIKVSFANRIHLDGFYEECKLLTDSVKHLLDLLKVSNNNSQNTFENKSDNNDNFKLMDLLETVSKIAKLSPKDLGVIKPYFCQVCNHSDITEESRNFHIQTLEHVTAIKLIEGICTYTCDHCGLYLILKNRQNLEGVINFTDHLLLDNTIKTVTMNNLFGKNNLVKKALIEKTNLKVSSENFQQLSHANKDINKKSIQSCQKQTEQVILDKPHERVSKTKTLKISLIFERFNKRFLSEELGVLFFCIPCDLGFNILQDWENHCKINDIHLKYMKNKSFKYYNEKCNLCNVDILGIKPLIKAYMKHHKDVNHYGVVDSDLGKQVPYNSNSSSPAFKGNSTKSINTSHDSSYNLTEKISSGLSIGNREISNEIYHKQSSSTKEINVICSPIFEDDSAKLSNTLNQLTFQENVNNKSKKIKPRKRKTQTPLMNKDGCSTSNESCQNGRFDANEKYPPVNPISKQEISSDTYHSQTPQINFPDKPLYNIFMEAISQKQKDFSNYVGTCLVCTQVLSDEFEWIGHLKKHEIEGNNENKEISCLKCGISVYGPSTFIVNELWKIKEHGEIDLGYG